MSYLPKAFTEEGPRPGAGAAPSAASEDSGMRERERERERHASAWRFLLPSHACWRTEYLAWIQTRQHPHELLSSIMRDRLEAERSSTARDALLVSGSHRSVPVKSLLVSRA